MQRPSGSSSQRSSRYDPWHDFLSTHIPEASLDSARVGHVLIFDDAVTCTEY